ncbi:unnamed protein product [Echinostoma caproni]|uniref:C2H2-type domain-containing protein n=1 Tax=Echinostoma caproni TaxID=27848 RepID=A0A182ZZQ0_9TREM|nr:unnamed protein product [Echinostoma caproni]
MSILVGSAKKSDHVKNNPDTDGLSSTVYICRDCPTFRTLTKETVDDHLSEVHHIPLKLFCHQTSTEISETNCPPSTAEPLQTPSSLRLKLSESVCETSWSSSSPPPRPNSPVSPLTKDNCQPRKKITITLNASPNLSLASETPVEIIHQVVPHPDFRSAPKEEEAENGAGNHSPHMHTFIDPGSTSSTLRSVSSSPEQKSSVQASSERPFYSERPLRTNSSEEYQAQHHETETVSCHVALLMGKIHVSKLGHMFGLLSTVELTAAVLLTVVNLTGRGRM